jgi:hypothetical protein
MAIAKYIATKTRVRLKVATICGRKGEGTFMCYLGDLDEDAPVKILLDHGGEVVCARREVSVLRSKVRVTTPK